MEITIRKAQPSDAEQIIAYVKRLSEEPISNIELSPGEFTVTVEEKFDHGTAVGITHLPLLHPRSISMQISRNLPQKLFALFTGALLGYFWGWIWGWSLFDPNSDIWALLAGVGALVGLIVGVTPFVWRYRGVLASASIGLYLSWIVRTLLFGDEPGGWGILILCLGSVAGWVIGVRLCSPADAKQKVITGLVAALYAGFFGGFLVDVVLLDILLGLVKTHSILNQAPAVLLCGTIGGIVFARWQARKTEF